MGQTQKDEDLLQWLRVTRARKPQNQKDAASAIGVSTYTYLKWETGKSVPQLKYVKALSQWADVSQQHVLSLICPTKN